MNHLPRPNARFSLWHVVLIALIGVFDLYVLYLVVNPNIDADYRAYYVDRSASCFPRLTTGYYPLGEAVSFVPDRPGYGRDTLRYCGFMVANATGIRSFGDYGILKLRFPDPKTDLLLSFVAYANVTTKDPERLVGVSINGEKLGTLRFAGPKRLLGHMIIPPEITAKGNGGLDIRFDVPRTGPPGTNGEPVTLTLRLQSLRVAPIMAGEMGGMDMTGAPILELDDLLDSLRDSAAAASHSQETELPPPDTTPAKELSP